MNFEMAAEMRDGRRRHGAHQRRRRGRELDLHHRPARRRRHAGRREDASAPRPRRGADLDGLKALGDRVNGRTRSMGVALTCCTVPAAGKPTFDLGEDEMEMGVGIHGEPGRRRVKLASADAIAEEMLGAILGDLAPPARRSEVLLLVNGFGGTPLMELYLMYDAAAQRPRRQGLKVARSLVGNYVTSLDMAGCSLTVTVLDDELQVSVGRAGKDGGIAVVGGGRPNACDRWTSLDPQRASRGRRVPTACSSAVLTERSLARRPLSCRRTPPRPEAVAGAGRGAGRSARAEPARPLHHGVGDALRLVRDAARPRAGESLAVPARQPRRATARPAMSDTAFEWLQQWYADHLDGEREHQNGVRIETLDNPGWSLSVISARPSCGSGSSPRSPSSGRSTTGFTPGSARPLRGLWRSRKPAGDGGDLPRLGRRARPVGGRVRQRQAGSEPGGCDTLQEGSIRVSC